MTKIEDATLEQITALLTLADQNLAHFSFAVRAAFPEMLKRLADVENGIPPEITLGDVLAWVEDPDRTEDELDKLQVVLFDTPNPAPPVVEPPSEPDWTHEEAWKHYDVGKFEEAQDLYTISVDSSMSQVTVAMKIEAGIYGADGSPLRVNVSGKCAPIYFGGGHKHAVITEGQPTGDVELFGVTHDAEICGLKFGTDKGGVNREVRISGDLRISPHGNEDGTGMGDKAAVHVRDHGTGLKLVFAPGSTCGVDPTWTDYDGMGCKWMIFGSDFELVVDADDSRAFCDPCREHSFYLKNMRFVFVENAWNDTRFITDAAGTVWELGNGRTFEQHTNRPPAAYPKGGPSSSGRVVYKNCAAHRCGWEGQLAWADSNGVVHPANLTTGGGSDFTGSGHTGDRKEILYCESIDGYAGAVANWSEQDHKSESPINPDGYRCWMFDGIGNLFDPATTDARLISAKWATRSILIVGFIVRGERHEQQRPAFLLSGTERLELDDLVVNSEPVDIDSPHLRLNHQSAAAPIRVVTLDGEAVGE